MSKHPFGQEKQENWLAFVQGLDAEINPDALRLMDKLGTVSHTLHQLGAVSLADTDLSYARFRLLMRLWFCEEFEGRSELNPSKISEMQGVSRSTISSLIRDLEANGLIERHLDKKDRRRFNISLTEDGRSRVHAYASQHFQIIIDRFSVLTPEEQTQLSDLLTKLIPH
ncbi:MAG: MarR family transcriptional regulator [Anaerolineales bacterium]|nr:MarR family transcriptional regulator [Anaerolineales bacterium]